MTEEHTNSGVGKKKKLHLRPKLLLLLILLPLAASFVISYVLSRQNEAAYDIHAPDVMVIQHKIYPLHAAIPAAGAPEDYEPLSFQLYGDGDLLCDNSGEAQKQAPAKAFSLKSGKLSRKELDKLYKSIEATGYKSEPGAIASNDISDIVTSVGRESISFLTPDGPKNVNYLYDSKTEQTDTYMKVKDILTQACKTYATNDHIPAEIRLTAKRIPILLKERILKANQAVELKASEAAGLQDTLKKVSSKAANDFSTEEITVKDQQAFDILNNAFSNSTTVIIDQSGGPVIIKYAPVERIENEKTATARDGLDEKLIAEHMQRINPDKEASTNQGPAESIKELVNPKAHAVSSYTWTFNVTYFTPNDHALMPGRASSPEGETAALADSIEDWYDNELGFSGIIGALRILRTNSVVIGNHGTNHYKSCNNPGVRVITYCNNSNTYSRHRAAYIQNIAAELNIDPNSAAQTKRIVIIDVDLKDHAIEPNMHCGLAPGWPAAISVQWWGKESGDPINNPADECAEHDSRLGDYNLGKVAAHEAGHTLGLIHTHADPSAGVPYELGQDIMNYNTSNNNQYPNNIHLSPVQKWFLTASPAAAIAPCRYANNDPTGCTSSGPGAGAPAPSIPPSLPLLPPIPTCTSGATRPDHLADRGSTPNPTECDDGQWVLYFDVWVPWAGSGQKHFVYYKNTQTGACGTKTGSPEGTLPPAGAHYMYAANCDDLDKIRQWLAAKVINEVGSRINALQDYQSQNSTSKNTDANTATFNKRNANKGMKTWASWEKPNGGGIVSRFPGYLPFPNFIPDYRGYLNVNSPNNLWGSMWGYIDGKWAAASNMAQYGKNSGPNTAMLFGPFENPGGDTWRASARGKKVMKVCWNIKDILAADTGNRQHSVVKLQTTSNGGNPWYNDAYMIVQLKGTGFNRYCRDNIKVPGSWVRDLEYPVTYLNGAIAVAEVERTLHWPENNYWVNFPFKDRFDDFTNDPQVKQANTANTECDYEEGHWFPSVGCKITSGSSITVESGTFSAPKTNGNKQICVIVTNVPNEHAIWAYVYKTNNSPARLTLRPTGEKDYFQRPLYCATYNSDDKSFKRVTISTSTPLNQPVTIHSLGIR